MMLRLRTLLILLVCLGTGLGLLAACGTAAPPGLSADTIAQQVGAYYQEAHPHVSKVISTQTDGSSHDPMYTITLTGHFQKGELVASSLSFSALANKMYIWSVHAYDQTGTEVWFERELSLAGR